MAALVDPGHLTPLMRGLPDALEIHVQCLTKKIEGTIEHNQWDP